MQLATPPPQGVSLSGLTPVYNERHLATKGCPFGNLPNTQGKSHWGERVTGEDMKTLRWVRPGPCLCRFVRTGRDYALRGNRGRSSALEARILEESPPGAVIRSVGNSSASTE